MSWTVSFFTDGLPHFAPFPSFLSTHLPLSPSPSLLSPSRLIVVVCAAQVAGVSSDAVKNCWEIYQLPLPSREFIWMRLLQKMHRSKQLTNVCRMFCAFLVVGESPPSRNKGPNGKCQCAHKLGQHITLQYVQCESHICIYRKIGYCHD